MTKDPKNAASAKNDKSEKSPVSIDVGFGVKASMEVSAEIPREDTGRLVAALTDIIRPFTEARGIKADRIRLQRENVLIEIAKKARHRAALENLPVNPVPTKLLVPFLEKASAEVGDNAMQDRWAALLLSASKAYQAKHLTFIDILSRLSADELRILETTCFSYKGFPETAYPNGHSDRNQRLIIEHSSMLDKPPLGTEKQAYDEFITTTVLDYGDHIHASVLRQNSGAVWFYTAYQPSQPKFMSLEILQHERLVDIRRVQLDAGPGKFGITNKLDIGYFEITKLGISFVMECSPDAAKMAARRPPPVQLQPATPEQARAIQEMLRKSRKNKK
ncbi:MAG: hypothetical protein ACREHF_11760 [Rhizomicrobium sp.]